MPTTSSSVEKRFNEVNFHDAQLLGVAIEQSGNSRSARVNLKLQLVTGARAGAYDRRPATLSFVDCAELSMNIDFWTKSMLGDSIDHASCRFDSERIAELSRSDPPRARSQPLNELLVFTIALCPVSGEMNVLARDFEISMG